MTDWLSPHIETTRLLIRKMHISDASVFFELNSDKDVVMYTGDTAFESLDSATNFFRERLASYEAEGVGRWTVILKSTGEVIGWCGLKNESGDIDLGYRFFKRHWNKGYASEAAKACLFYGFKTLGLKRIVARAMKENVASIKVMEKIGMKYHREFECALHPGIEYEMLATDFTS